MPEYAETLTEIVNKELFELILFAITFLLFCQLHG